MLKKRIKYRICSHGVWLLVLLLYACSKEPMSPTAAADRTLIVYLAGDNNLSAESFQKLEAMTAVVAKDQTFASGQAKVIVYHDPAEASGAAPSLWRLKYGMAHPQLIETYPTENSASTEVLARVIETAKKIAPAKSYALWMFSHASGWLPKGALANPAAAQTPRSIVVDGKQEMEIAELAEAIDGFDIIIFEACFMASVEVAWELKDKTRYIIASSAEMLSPGLTKIYAKTLPMIFDHQSQTDPLTAITSIAKTYFNNQNSLTAANRSATISVINTKNIEQLAQITSRIIASAQSVSSELSGSFGLSGFFSDVAAIQHFDRLAQNNLFFDLEQYLTAIAATPTERQKLKEAMAATVPYAAATPQFMIGGGNMNGFEIEHHSGLTTYIQQPQLTNLNTAYRNTNWYKTTHE